MKLFVLKYDDYKKVLFGMMCSTSKEGTDFDHN